MQHIARGAAHGGDGFVVFARERARRGRHGFIRAAHLAFGRNHSHRLIKEGRQNRRSRVQIATWVIAQIEHQTLHLRVLFVQGSHLRGEVLHRALLEVRHADPAIARLDHFAFDRDGFDQLARNRHGEAAAFGLAFDAQAHLRVGFAAHAFDRFAQRQRAHIHIVNFGDQVA